MRKNKLAAVTTKGRMVNFFLNFVIALLWLLRSAFRFFSGRFEKKNKDAVKKE